MNIKTPDAKKAIPRKKFGLPTDLLTNKKPIRELTPEEEEWIELIEYSMDDALVEKSAPQKS